MLHEVLLSYRKPFFGITIVSTTKTTGTTVAYPAGVKAGDLLIYFDRGAHLNVDFPFVVPAGFTSISQNIGLGVSNKRKVAASYRLATGPLTGNVTGMDAVSGGSGSNSKAMFLIRELTGLPFTAVTHTNYGYASSATVDPISHTSATTGLATNSVFFSQGAAGTISSVTSLVSNQVFDAVNTPSAEHKVGYKTYTNGATADNTVTSNASGGNLFYVDGFALTFDV